MRWLCLLMLLAADASAADLRVMDRSGRVTHTVTEDGVIRDRSGRAVGTVRRDKIYGDLKIRDRAGRLRGTVSRPPRSR